MALRSGALFLDMQGALLFDGSVAVVGRAANTNGAARWTVRFLECGHEQTYEGIYLRRRKGAPRCPVCKHAREPFEDMPVPGWVRRLYAGVAGTPHGSALRAFVPFSAPGDLESPETALAALPRWETAWLAELGVKSTAIQYASRIRVALRTFIEDNQERP